MVTQKDISAACGVSVSAVSKALSDYPDISEETKNRIRDVAQKMGYHEMKTEPRLKREHTYTVGLLLTREMERESSMNVIRELRKALVRRGYDLILLSPSGEETRAAGRPGYLPRARLYGMEGVFLFSRVQEIELYRLEGLRNLRELILGEIPVVAVGCVLAPCRCVVPGYEKGIRSLVRELYRRGHRRIAFVCRGSERENSICRRAIHIALIENHLEVPAFYFRHIESDNVQESFAQTMDLLQRNRWLRPTCILFTDDMLLEGGAAAVRECGLRIPEDIAVAAIRISERPRYTECPVISWRISPAKIAEAAVEQMLDAGEGLLPGQDLLPETAVLPGAGKIRMIDGMLYDDEPAQMKKAY